MKKRSKEYYALCAILLLTLFLYGCGNGNSMVSNQKGTVIIQDEAFYVPKEILLPEYSSFDSAYSDGYDLYYAAADYNEASQTFQTSFYSLKQGETEPKLNFSLTENQRVQTMVMDTEGNTYYLGYDEPLQDTENNPAAVNTFLYKTDSKGAPLLTLDLSEYTKGQEQSVIQDLAVDEENRMILCTSDQKIYILSPEGNLLFETGVDGRIFDICNSSGKIWIVYGNTDGMEVREIDMPGKKLSSRLTGGIPGTQFYLTAGRDGNLLIASGESVYQYTPESEELIKKFDWQTYDFNGIVSGILLPYGENDVLVISRNYNTFPMKAEGTVFLKAEEGETAIPKKEVITLGIIKTLVWTKADTVSSFNKANADYKIEIKNYNGDYTRLNMDIIAGNGPDILALPSYQIDLLAEKGALEDLNPYFEKDETLNRSDFMENVLDAFQTEGHLYGMPVTFELHTMVGKTSVLGERAAWDLDELIAFTQSFPEGTAIFDNTSKSGVLNLLKYAYTRQLVDRNNPENPLDRELLLKMLEFANQYESDDRYVQEIDKLNWKILDGQVMVPDIFISSVADYYGYCDMFGEPVTFIGYPTSTGNGSLISSPNAFAISSNSEHKEVAWEFISTLLSEEGQKIMTIGDFPLRKESMDYFSNFIMDRCINFIASNSNSNLAYYFTKGDAIPEEDVAVIEHLIQQADTALRDSPDINKIIEEEAAFYFDGTKPAEEVVAVIENRIRTYVNENN